MTSIAKIYESELNTRYFGPAIILHNLKSRDTVAVRIPTMPEFCDLVATVATPYQYAWREGDEILVAGEDINNLYVIGLLKINHSEIMTAVKLDLGGGAHAVVDEELESPILRIYSRNQELAFEYDPDDNKVTVCARKGDLEFVSPDGDIEFNTQGNIRLKADEVEILGRSKVSLNVVDTIGNICSSVSLGSKMMAWSSNILKIAAQRGLYDICDTQFTGEKLLARVKYMKLTVAKYETIADTIKVKAINIYKTVEQLSQVKTDRMRMIVESTCHLKSNRTLFKTNEEFKIKSDKIHLG